MTAALKRGDVASPRVASRFRLDARVPNTAFKRVVRDLDFDVAELAIVTFLMAKAKGVPLTLLPAVLVARFQHPFIVYRREPPPAGAWRSQRPPGRGIRSYTVTTVAWIRAVLANDYGVDLGSVRRVTI